jgi:ABC-type antimicrobial peptide transport system permease subunit
MISDTLDIDTLLSDINNIPLINMVMLIVLPYLGGLAGFFLLVSAIGNMVSIQRHLQAGKSVKSLFWKQVIGGFILLFFAFISEGFMSLWGTVGSFFWHINDPLHTDITLWLYQGYNFETIHTIAWCVILNGIVQAILSRKEGWKNPKKLIKIYIILAIIVICATQFVWWGVSAIIPGYPWAINPLTGQPLFKPMLGTSPFWEIIVGIFGFGILMGILGGLYPAIKATRVAPMETLKAL